MLDGVVGADVVVVVGSVVVGGDVNVVGSGVVDGRVEVVDKPSVVACVDTSVVGAVAVAIGVDSC